MRILEKGYNMFNRRFAYKMLVGGFLFIALALSPKACIEPFINEIDEIPSLITIEGGIIKGDSLQQITITKTATLMNPQHTPVEGCEVKIVDGENNEFVFSYKDFGKYVLAIPDELLVFNSKYRLVITAPDGHIYESLYENLNRSLDIDTVYYEIEERTTAYTEEDFKGLQFYVDVKAADTISRYFRWKLTETYEYTTTGPISYIYMINDDGEFEKYVPDDKNEVFRCWISYPVQGIFVSNTTNLTINEKKKIPLHFVSNRSDRLKIKYSLLVNQYTMNEGAYKYLQQNKVAIEESHGLYTTQPGQPVSNLSCVNDSLESVLGYFWVSSRTEQRIFIPRINSFTVYGLACEIYEFNPEYHKKLPRYIRVTDTGIELTGHPNCFDCTLSGGKLIPPDFWE
jgi:hypothetical protein